MPDSVRPIFKIPKESVFNGKKVEYKVEDTAQSNICITCLKEIVLDAHSIYEIPRHTE
jgi:hypothetical protein